MRKESPQQKFLTELVRLNQYLDFSLPYCTDEDVAYQTVKVYYRHKAKKPSEKSMRTTAKLYVGDVRRKKQQRLTHEQLHRPTTI